MEIALRSSYELVPGDTVEAQFPNSWTMLTGPSFTRELQTSDAKAPHYVAVTAPGATFAVEIRSRHLFTPDKPGRHGRHIVATLAKGRVPAGVEIRLAYANTFAPYVAETDTVWLRVKGESPRKPVALTVTPLEAASLRILAPSFARPGKRFNVRIVSLDRFDNLSSTRFRGRTLRRSDGKTVARKLSFTGGTSVPLVLRREGVFRFSMNGVISNAVKVAKEARGPYWGDLHIHTKVSSDGQGTDPYGYAREVSALDFGATADHVESMGEAGYRQTVAWLEAAHDPGRFVTIPADERNPAAWTGHHNLSFRSLEAFLAGARAGGESEPVPGDAGTTMLVPHHTGIGWGGGPTAGKGAAVDWDAVDDRGRRPVMEIYSHHGQSEVYAPEHILSYELNRMRNPERRSNVSVPGPFYAQDYWMAGRRIGVIASSDEHSGQGGRRHGGLAAVFAKNLTREDVFDALRARQCYATTGERILLDFSVAGATTGNETSVAKGAKVPVRLRVWGADLLLRVELLRFRQGIDRGFIPIWSVAPRPESMDCALDMDDDIVASAIYYARMVQEPLAWPGMAWTSPVWVDVRGES